MEGYTDRRESEIDDFSPEDEDYEQRLLEAAKRFRHFDKALDAFLFSHGYDGDPDSVERKAAFIRSAFERAGMHPPREIRKWYGAGQAITRETAFQICFAFDLCVQETDDFFRRVYMRERSFDCHVIAEAVYYFCMRRGLSYAQAREILSRIPDAPDGNEDAQREVLYTSSILRVLDQIGSEEELVAYLTQKRAQFRYNNATAYGMIARLWHEIAGADGLLEREQAQLVDGELRGARCKAGGFNVENALLAILQLDRKSVGELPGDRSLGPLLSLLPQDISASFPDRQGLEKILHGRPVCYERVRKWLILLKFYHFWATRALSRASYAAQRLEEDRCRDEIDLFLTDAGYMTLYPGNPYDWLFLFAAHQEDPLGVFRELWNSLMVMAQAHP